MQHRAPQVIVVGAGPAGSAVALGLARSGMRVAMLDQEDAAFRAGRSRLGLLWVQGEGAGRPRFARWLRGSAERWGDFAGLLASLTGLDIGFRRTGGLAACLSERELEAQVGLLERLRRECGNHGYDYEVLDARRLAERCPGISGEAVGGVYSPWEGEVSVLRFMRGLHAAFARAGGAYLSGARVRAVEPLPGGGFRVCGERGELHAARVVIAAGRDTPRLAAQVGLRLALEMSHGELLVTEPAGEHRLPVPLRDLRQLADGSLIMGGEASGGAASADRHAAGALGDVARRCTRLFPFLGALRVLRRCPSQRHVTADRLPVYRQSTACPGAYGIVGAGSLTLAAVHATDVADWIRGASPTLRFDPATRERLQPLPAG